MGTIYRPTYRGKDGEKKESRIYWVKYYKGGKPFYESSGSAKHDDAKKLLKVKEGRVAQGLPIGVNVEKVKFTDLVDLFLRDYAINKRRSAKRAEQLASNLKGFFEGYRAVQVADKVSEYIDKRQTEGATNGTINRELSALRRMFTLGRKKRMVAGDFDLDMLEENNIRSGFFEHEEFLALRGAIADHARLPITIAYYTGMRLGEIFNLKWDQINLTEGKILLSPLQTKNKTPRTVYLRGELYQAFMMAKEIRDRKYPGCLWVCHLNGSRIKSIRRAWKTGLKRVGLEGRLFHDFRRTGARNMIRAGIPEKVAMSVGGWKTRSVFDRYNIVNDTDLEAAADKMETLRVSMVKDSVKVPVLVGDSEPENAVTY